MNGLDSLNLPEEIKAGIKEWTGDEYDEETRKEILNLVKNKDEKELTDRFYKTLEFGTGGIRGIMGAGTNRINKYNIGKAAQGLCNYLNEEFTDNISAVIAYDSRHFSDSFSMETALIMAGNNIKVYLFESLRPTPMLSFAVRYLKANTGIVITASHNPAQYNGYKVYWKDGGQIVPPHDKEIIAHVKKITALNQISSLKEDEAKNKGLLNIIGKEVDDAYYEKVNSLSINSDIINKVADDINIVFTPIHGAGNIPVRRILSDFGFKNVFTVPQQEKPDGDFPTVKYPNPEEGEALEIGMNLCKEKNADILVATDPDADRLAVAIKGDSNDYVQLNGNQMVSMLTYYMLSQLKEHNKLPENSLIVKTVVTTDLVKKIALSFNAQIKETLTGFKYIGEQIKINEDLNNQDKPFKQYIFGGEESYGMLAGDFVRDKDGVSTSAMFAEMAAYLKYNNKTLMGYLDGIYKEYGYHSDKLEYIVLKGKDGMERIKRIMDTFRNDPPSEVNDLKLLKIGDIQKGELVNLENKEVELKYDLRPSNVLILYLENNMKISMRPSGTEPKIKFYFEGVQTEVNDLEKAKQEVDLQVDKVSNEFLKIVKGI